MRANDNARGFTRVPFSIETLLVTGSHRARGLLQDLSFTGAHIQTPDRVPVGTACKMALFLGSEQAIPMQVDAQVVRHTDSGMGVVFTRLGIPAYEHLKALLLSSARAAVRTELRHTTGLPLRTPPAAG